MNLEWTEERTEVLRLRWSAGDSASIIGTLLGVTRSAVIGKVHRLGLPGRHTSQRDYRQYRRKSKSQNAQSPPPAPTKPRTFKIGPDPWTPRDVEQIPEAERVSLLDLADNHCRYPFGEGRYITFCGRERVAGISYCASHARTCFTEHRVQLPEKAADEQPQNLRELEAVS